VDAEGCGIAVDAKAKAENVADSGWLKGLARVGLIAYGLVYLLMGWLALQLAWGGRSKSPDPSGAFGTLAEQPLGRILLAVIAVVLVALGVWQAGEAAWGHRNLDGIGRLRERFVSGFWACVYSGFGVRSAWVAFVPTASGSGSQRAAKVGVLSWPGGQTLVVMTGLVVLCIGLAAGFKGITQSFSEEIDTSRLSSTGRKAVLNLGQVGYLTKGVALGLAGGLLSYAAWTFDWKKASGLDAALQTVLHQPFGRWLLSAMALGFVAFGLFAMLQFRYRRM
jgi:hypothetical protein